MFRKHNQSQNRKKVFRPFRSRQEGRTTLFNGGPGIDWLRARPEIINCFKGAGCWDYVNPWTDMEEIEVESQGVSLYVLSEEDQNLVEEDFTEPEPVKEELVDNLYQEYLTSIDEYERENSNRIMRYYRLAKRPPEGQDEISPEEKRKLTLEINKMENELEKELLQKRQNKNVILMSLKKSYDDAWKTWNTKKSDHAEKVKSVIKVFTEKLGHGPLALIKLLLDKGKFKSAWYRLNKYYLSEMGAGGSRAGLFLGLESLVFNERQGLETLMKNLELLFAHTKYSDDDELKIHYLTQSIRRGGFKGFDQTISSLEVKKVKSFAEFADALKIRYDTIMRENRTTSRNNNEMDKMYNVTHGQNDDNNNNNNNNKRPRDGSNRNNNNKKYKFAGTCNNCGKKGHKAEDCWELNKCEICGQLGHPGWKCPQNTERIHHINVSQSSYKESMNNSNKRNDNSNKSKSNKDKNRTVELTSMFKNKHGNPSPNNDN
jgi:hypothetical protein